MKFGILGISFETGNLGVNVLGLGILKGLLNHRPDAEVYLLDYGKSSRSYTYTFSQKSVNIPLIPMRFSIKLLQSNNVAILVLLAFLSRLAPTKALRNMLVDRNRTLRVIRDTDAFGSIAGGDSFADIYGLRVLLYVLLPQILVLIMGKPLIQLPQTYGPYRTLLGRLLAGWVLKHSRAILSRDHESIPAVRSLPFMKNQSPEPLFSYDVGFLLDSTPALSLSCADFVLSARKCGRQLIGVNPSGLLAMGGYNRNNMFQLKVDYCSMMEQLIMSCIERHHGAVLLIPHVPATQTTPESDLRAIDKLIERLSSPQIFAVRDKLNEREIKSLIGTCHLFTGSRMHACIAALSQGVPAIGIAYSRKFRGVFKSIGVEELVIDPCALDLPQIVERFNTLVVEVERFRELLNMTMPNIRVRTMEGLALFVNAVAHQSSHTYKSEACT